MKKQIRNNPNFIVTPSEECKVETVTSKIKMNLWANRAENQRHDYEGSWSNMPEDFP
jgi:hypothetical protein